MPPNRTGAYIASTHTASLLLMHLCSFSKHNKAAFDTNYMYLTNINPNFINLELDQSLAWMKDIFHSDIMSAASGADGYGPGHSNHNR